MREKLFGLERKGDKGNDHGFFRRKKPHYEPITMKGEAIEQVDRCCYLAQVDRCRYLALVIDNKLAWH